MLHREFRRIPRQVAEEIDEERERKKTFGGRRKRSEKGEESRDVTSRSRYSYNNYSYLAELPRTVRRTPPRTSSSYRESAGRRLGRREKSKSGRERAREEIGGERMRMSLDETDVYTQDERILIAEADGTRSESLRRGEACGRYIRAYFGRDLSERLDSRTFEVYPREALV